MNVFKGKKYFVVFLLLLQEDRPCQGLLEGGFDKPLLLKCEDSKKLSHCLHISEIVLAVLELGLRVFM